MLPGVQHRDDVGMMELLADPDLLQKAIGAKRFGELGPEDLDRDIMPALLVAGQVDDCRSAMTNLALDLVATGKQSGKNGGRTVLGV